MERSSTKSILITGIHSYIGNGLKEYICHNDLPVEVATVSMRDDSFKKLDYSQFNSIVHVASIVHQKAGKIDFSDYYHCNVEKTIEIAQLAKEAGVIHFVFLSSMAVYGSGVIRINKDSIPQPDNYYGRTKLIAEEKLLELADDNFKIAIVRPPMVYGKDCPGNYKVLSRLASRVRFFPEIENERSMIYIDNLSIYLYEIINSGSDGIYHPQNVEYVNTFNLVQEIASCHGHDITGIKILNPMINVLRKYISVFKKVFGDLTYDKSLSILEKGNYHLVEFKETIKETET